MVAARRTTLAAAALVATLGAVAANAQTLVVQNAPAGSPIEFVLNGTTVATETAGADGLATLAAGAAALGEEQAQTVLIWVDECDTLRRIVVMTATQPPPASGACRRTQMTGQFRLQRVTSLLVDLRTTPPTLRLRQGPVPAAWLRTPAQAIAAAAEAANIVPDGVILSAGGGLGRLSEFAAQACGDVPGCSDDDPLPASGAVAVWFSPWVGAEGAFIRAGTVRVEGAGEQFRFDSALEGGVVAAFGKFGVPIGRVRPFGMAGPAYHRATITTTQIFDPATPTGDALTYQWRSEGWGLAVGGGVEVWITNRIGLFGAFSRVDLKGDDVAGSEARTDARLSSVIVGGRFRLLGF